MAETGRADALRGGGGKDAAVMVDAGRTLTFMERVQRSGSVSGFRRHVSKTKGADKLAIFFWLAVDFCWCQELGNLGMGAAVIMMVCCTYTLSVAQSSPHEVLHCCSVLLWAGANLCWMYMELGQARVRSPDEYHGMGAGRDDWMLLKLAAVVLFSVALAVELTYFIFLRHTGYYEGAWRSDPVTAEVVRRNQRLNVGVSVEDGSGGGGGGGQYGATLGLDAPRKEEEMYTVLPRFPAFFKTWNDYEAVAIMIWIGKDFSWMACTEFGKDHHLMEASKVAWLTCTCLVFAIHFDFFLTSINTKDTVEWVTYLSMLLWACSQTLWAGGEIFLHEPVIKRENVLKEPENYNNLRWYAGWFALLSLMVLYSFWFGKTVASITADCHATHKEEGEDGDIRM